MAEQSQFWTTNGTGDGSSGGYTLADWNDIFTKLFAPGLDALGAVLPLVGNNLAVTGAATPLSVDTGAAIVAGFLYENTTSKSLAVTTPTLGTTGGRVILRCDKTAQTVRAVISQSANGVAALPALTQSGTVWEIPLANYSITTGGVVTLTDVRSYAHHATKIGAIQIDIDSVDDTQVGNRVPQFSQRRGGNSSSWLTAGTTNYVPTGVKMCAGVHSPSPAGTTNGNFTVTLPITFSAFGLAVAQAANDNIHASAFFVANNQISIVWRSIDGVSTLPVTSFTWIAIGPE